MPTKHSPCLWPVVAFSNLIIMLVKQALAAVGSACMRVLFKLGQAAFFIPMLFIVMQAAVARVMRLVCYPRALRIVEEGRRAQQRREEAAVGVSSPDCELEDQQPFHVFTDASKGNASLAWQLIGPFVRKYGGHTLSHMQLSNPEYAHFFMPGVGSLPYVLVDKYNRVSVVVVGQPLADRSDWRQLTELFLLEFPEAWFSYINADYAELLHDMGLYINAGGAEPFLQVQTWRYTKQMRRTIPGGARGARNSGVRVRELSPEDLTHDMRRVLQQDVAASWRQQKAVSGRELRVFTPQVDFNTLELTGGVRLFVAEAYNPEAAPPAYVDAALHDALPRGKPPKPFRRTRKQSNSAANVQANNNPDEAQGAKSTSTTAACADGSVHVNVSQLISNSSSGGSSSNGSSNGSNRRSSCGGSSSSSMPLQSSNVTSDAPAELVGLVLLHPMWEDGREMGFVTSLMHMKPDTHRGTLKLLIEDIISTLRREGRRELTFGGAPLFNLSVGQQRFARYIGWMHWSGLYLYNFANNLYPFKSLAFFKCSYGAGLNADKTAFNDPNVTLAPIFKAGRHYCPGLNVLDEFAFYRLVGMVDDPVTTFLKIVGLKPGCEHLNKQE